jgi:hypothetical protein
MNYVVELGSGAMIYMKMGSGIQTLMGVGKDVISLVLFFQNEESTQKMLRVGDNAVKLLAAGWVITV